MLSGRYFSCEEDGKREGFRDRFRFPLVGKKLVLILLRVLIPEWINEIIIERIIVLVRGKGVTYECCSVVE
jgi:hypothetical protein